MSSKSPKERVEVIIRPAELRDIPQMAAVAQETYAEDPVSLFLCPKADKYPEDVNRRFRHRGHVRHTDLRSLNVVACLASSPSTVVAYMQATRLGDDEGAREYVYSKSSMERLRLRIVAWFFWAKDGVERYLWPDRSVDRVNETEFAEWNNRDDETHWNSHPDRQNRWHAQSVAVLPKWQGMGIGRKLMGNVLERAQRENVICGLSASPAGEKLYTKLGFELLGDFCERVPVEGQAPGGGIMIWRPESGDAL